MVKQIVVLTLGCALLLCGCRPTPGGSRQQVKQETMSGHWVSADVLNRYTKTQSTKLMPEFPPYTELIFMPDSGRLLALNGQVELVMLSYVRKGNTVRVEDFYGSGETLLTLVNDSSLVFADEIIGKQWSYSKVPAEVVNGEGMLHEAFPTLLNAALIAGEYTVTNADKPYTITFRGNGYIFGSPSYTRYMMCYSGDCINFSQEELIYLSNGSHGDYYGWRKQGDVLTIFTLKSVSAQDEMPDYVFDKPILVMKKN